MLKRVGLDIEVGNLLDLTDFEAANLVANLDIVRNAVLTSWDVYSELMCLASGFHNFSCRGLLLLHFAERALYKITSKSRCPL